MCKKILILAIILIPVQLFGNEQLISSILTGDEVTWMKDNAGILLFNTLFLLSIFAVFKFQIRRRTDQLKNQLSDKNQLSEKEQAALSSQKSEKNMLLLNEFTLEILKKTDLKSIYQCITTQLQEQFRNVIILYVSIDKVANITKLESVSGLDKSLLSKFIKISGFNPVGKTYKLTKTHHKYFKSGNLVRFEGGLVEFAANEYPKMAAQTIEKIIGIGNIYTIGINKDDSLLAAIHFFTKKDHEINDKAFIETFVRQAGLVIQTVIAREELTVAKEKAEESDRLKSLFLQNISHEVRTPLNAIVGFSQLMAELNLPKEKLKEYSEQILSGSEKLTGIIKDIIEMSQVQANQIKVQQSEFDLVKLIHDTTEKFSERIRDKLFTLKVDKRIPDEKLMIVSDKEKLQVILTHLIDNAIKFTTEGTVEIIYGIKNNALYISIADTGIGISPETKKIIFEPFRQFETDMHRRYGGNGLGLSLVKAYAELLGGTVNLESEIHKGTTVHITLPASGTEKKQGKTETGKSRTKQGKGKTVKPSKSRSGTQTVLIAEDEHANYLYLKEIIGNKDVTILHAADGQEAIDLCRGSHAIDIIFMDIKMPVMDGHTAARLIKEFRPDVPIIAQTAYVLESEKEQFSDVFDDYVTKPFDSKRIKQLVSEYLKSRNN